MSRSSDTIVQVDDWSDLSRHRGMPEIDFDRMRRYRIGRTRQELKRNDAATCMLVNSISLRYAADYRSYALFQLHIPTSYLFVPEEEPVVIHGLYGARPMVDDLRTNRALSYFDGGPVLGDSAPRLAEDVVNFLSEICTDNRRIAVEYGNHSLTRALMQRGLEVFDGALISEKARVIKSPDEVACIKWAVEVAELGIANVKEALRPGLTLSEFQRRAFPVPEEHRENAYACVAHAVGKCDECPRINPGFRGANSYDGVFEAGIVLCIESYMVAEGETGVGVKLEQQVLVTDDGHEMISSYPLEDALME